MEGDWLGDVVGCVEGALVGDAVGGGLYRERRPLFVDDTLAHALCRRHRL